MEKTEGTNGIFCGIGLKNRLLPVLSGNLDGYPLNFDQNDIEQLVAKDIWENYPEIEDIYYRILKKYPHLLEDYDKEMSLSIDEADLTAEYQKKARGKFFLANILYILKDIESNTRITVKENDLGGEKDSFFASETIKIEENLGTLLKKDLTNNKGFDNYKRMKSLLIILETVNQIYFKTCEKKIW